MARVRSGLPSVMPEVPRVQLLHGCSAPGAVESHKGQTFTEDRSCCDSRETGNVQKAS